LGEKWITLNLRTSLHDENILALTLLGLEEILFFKLNTIIETLRRRDEGFSCFASRREILNDKFLDIRISKIRNWVSAVIEFFKKNCLLGCK
jgi:hypothetical protein